VQDESWLCKAESRSAPRKMSATPDLTWHGRHDERGSLLGAEAVESVLRGRQGDEISMASDGELSVQCCCGQVLGRFTGAVWIDEIVFSSHLMDSLDI